MWIDQASYHSVAVVQVPQICTVRLDNAWLHGIAISITLFLLLATGACWHAYMSFHTNAVKLALVLALPVLVFYLQNHVWLDSTTVRFYGSEIIKETIKRRN